MNSRLSLLIITTLFLLHNFCGSRKEQKQEKDATRLKNKSIFVTPKRTQISDTILVFDMDSFNYYYQRDVKAIDDSIALNYTLLEDKVLIDSVSTCLYGLPFHPEFANESLGCELARLSIRKKVPDAFAVFGKALLDCKCSCNEYKGITYILKGYQKKSNLATWILKFYYTEKLKNYIKAEKLLLELSNFYDDLGAKFELYYLYSEGSLNLGAEENKEKFQNKKKAEYYLEECYKAGLPEAIKIKADRLWYLGKKDTAFKFYIEAYEQYNKQERYTNEIDMQIILDESLSQKYGVKWESYKKNNFTD